MMIFTAKLTKKKIALCVVLAGLCVGLVILLAGLRDGDAPAAPERPSPEGIADNKDRVAYLEAYGWQVTADPVETLRLVLPKEISGSWGTYNELQLQQGFDLSLCCGEKAERFTYAVTNYPGIADGVQANLYLCGDTVVAGDIFCTGENGFQAALQFPEDTGVQNVENTPSGSSAEKEANDAAGS